MSLAALVGEYREAAPAQSEQVVYDAVVLGAGISGLVSASLLARQGCTNILVIDQYDHIGGNHIDRAHGGYTFDIGSLIFQDDSPLLQHFPELLPLYQPIQPTWGRLNPQGVVTKFPISIKRDIIDAGVIEWMRILTSLAYARLFYRSHRNARDFAQYCVGNRFLDRSGLEHYMERFCGRPAEFIEVQFAEKRMQWLKQSTSISAIIRRCLNLDLTAPANRQLARPRAGFAALYQSARQVLEQRGVSFKLGAEFLRLSKRDDQFQLECQNQSILAKRVISTIPINQSLKICGLEQAALPAVSLISLFFSFSGNRGFDQSILYNFSKDGTWKRLTAYSDFYGRVHDREFFTVEVLDGARTPNVEVAEAQFRRHVTENGLFAGDLQLEGSYLLSNAYPLYTDGSHDQANQAIAVLKAFGIESHGRQGAFNYQPTARISTLDAEATLGGRPAHSAQKS